MRRLWPCWPANGNWCLRRTIIGAGTGISRRCAVCSRAAGWASRASSSRTLTASGCTRKQARGVRPRRPAAAHLFDLGPHLIDQALALFGAPSHVWADVRIAREDVSVDDTFDLELTYAKAERAGKAACVAARECAGGERGRTISRCTEPMGALKSGAWTRRKPR